MAETGKIRQNNEFDCGAACLCSIASYYGLELPMAEVRKACGCSRDGITIQGIIEGAKSIGLHGTGFKSPEREIGKLSKAKGPFIAHTKTEEGYLHYIVVRKITDSGVYIMDPAFGSRIKMSYDEFSDIWTGYLILLTPGSGFSTGNRKKNVYWRMLGILTFHKREISLAIAGSVVLVLLGICNSIFIQQIIDKVIPSRNKSMLAFISLILLTLLVFAFRIGYARAILMLRNGIKIDTRLIFGYIRKIFGLPLDFFYQYTSGDINSRISDAFNIRVFLSDGLVSVFVSIITVLASFILMFCYYSRLAVLICMFVPLYLLLFGISTHINKKYNREIAILNARFDTDILESLDGITEIKHFGAENLSIKRIENSYVDLMHKTYGAGKSMALLSMSGGSISGILAATVLTAGAFSVFGMHLTMGELVSFYTLTSFFTSPLNELANINGMITEAAVSAERLFEIIDLNSEDCKSGLPVRITNIPETKAITGRTVPDLEISGLTFSYPGRKALFENLNLRINGGSLTVVEGESGCGKSTLGALIMRDYEPGSGHIFGAIRI